jgi:hypothetical protein
MRSVLAAVQNYLTCAQFQHVLAHPGYSKTNGVQLTVATCNNTANQHWTLP